MSVNERALRNEAVWLEVPTATVIDLARQAGHPNATILGLVGWLEAKKAGLDDLTGSPTRARYRRILAELEPQLGRPARRARRPKKGELGSGAIPGLLNRPGRPRVFAPKTLAA